MMYYKTNLLNNIVALSISFCLVLVGCTQEAKINGAIRKLEDKNVDARFKAADILVKIGAPAVEPLIAAMKNKNSDVRLWAALILGKIKDTRAIESLITAMKDENSDVQEKAGEALSEIGTPALEFLLVDLKKGDLNIRKNAIWALGKIKDPRSAEPLLKLLKDESIDIRRKAAEALYNIKPTNPSYVKALIDTIRDKDSIVRYYALKALEGTNDVSAVNPLIIALKDEDANIREEAAKTLGDIKDTRAMKFLILALDDNPNVQKEAANALEKIGSPAIKPLFASLNDKNVDFRKRGRVLRNIIKGRANEPLIAVMKNNLALAAAAYPFFIEFGVSGTEDILIDALNKRGSKEMAIDFLNCGNSNLAEAARTWAENHGYHIFEQPSSTFPRKWGHL